MLNVFLLGDSIRKGAANSPGYGVYVKELLAGKANVYAPEDNCRFAQYTLRGLYDWVNETDGAKIDVIHWNNGLWDVLRIFGDEPLTPIDQYVEFLRRIHGQLVKLWPGARIIFALSTAVIEEWGKPEFMRYNREIEAYNAAAAALMAELGVEVNDLYAVTKDFDPFLHADWVHYNEEGSRLLAEIVANIIMNEGA